MTVTEITSKRGVMDDDCAEVRPFAPIFDPTAKRRAQHLQVGRFLITLTTVVIAGLLGWAMWCAYMGAPWTRDATVRAYVVMMAPEVSGRIVELHVVDNKYVRKGDLLMVIDPTNYMIAVSQAEASVQQAQASVRNIDAQMTVSRRRSAPIGRSWTRYRLGSSSPNSRHRATRIWRRQAPARFKMLSSLRPSWLNNEPQ